MYQHTARGECKQMCCVCVRSAIFTRTARRHFRNVGHSANTRCEYRMLKNTRTNVSVESTRHSNLWSVRNVSEHNFWVKWTTSNWISFGQSSLISLPSLPFYSLALFLSCFGSFLGIASASRKQIVRQFDGWNVLTSPHFSCQMATWMIFLLFAERYAPFAIQLVHSVATFLFVCERMTLCRVSDGNIELDGRCCPAVRTAVAWHRYVRTEADARSSREK